MLQVVDMKRLECSAFHEAAHAVTAEFYAPGSVREISLEPEWSQCWRGIVYCPAATHFNEPGFPPGPDFAAVLAASKYGEALVGETDPFGLEGDVEDLRLLGLRPWELAMAYRRAKKVVLSNKEAISRIAALSMDRLRVSGDEIRALLTNNCIEKASGTLQISFSRTESQGTRPDRSLTI